MRFDLIFSSLSRSYFVERKRFGHFETDRHRRTHDMRLCVSLRSASPDQDTGPKLLAASNPALWWAKTVVGFRVGRMHTAPASPYPRIRELPRRVDQVAGTAPRLATEYEAPIRGKAT